MKLKELEQILSSVKPFQKPKLELEQYATDAHIAGMHMPLLLSISAQPEWFTLVPQVLMTLRPSLS